MTINAKEARKNTEQLTNENTAKMIGDLDSKIDQAIYEGNFTITTPQLKGQMKKVITEHYKAYDYEVIDYNNNMLGINW